MAHPGEPPETGRRSRGWRSYAALLAAVLLTVLVLQNMQEVDVDFLFVETKTPLIFALVLAGALGAFLGWAVPRIRRGGRD